MRVLVVRHAETEANAAGICQGQSEFPLSSVGRAQARALGVRLAGEAALSARVFCSDLGRARQTLAEAAASAPWLLENVVYTPLLRERALGAFERRPVAEFNASVRTLSTSARRTHRPPGGESWRDVEACAASFLQTLLLHELFRCPPASPSGCLVLSHGGCICCLLTACGLVARGRPANTGIYTLAARGRDPSARGGGAVAWTVVSANDTAHLLSLSPATAEADDCAEGEV